MEYHGVEPKAKVMQVFQTPAIHPSTSAFIDLGPICIPDQASFIIWVKPILPFMLARKLSLE
jgi:hypothetical protein